MSTTVPRPPRPTTPLRRISSHSLRSLSLSHSHAHDPSSPSSSTAPSPLSHLSPVFLELAQSVQDFVVNCQDAHLVADGLDRFNEAFAAYLYGLRTNSYTVDFVHAPEKLGFQLAHERREAAALALNDQRGDRHDDDTDDDNVDRERVSSPPRSPTGRSGPHGGDDRTVGETTFMTNDDQSFSHPSSAAATRTTGAGGTTRTRGGSTTTSGIARGRGRGMARGAGVVTKRRKDEMAALADPVFPLLPINIRENRRTECEKVLWTLKENPEGLGLADLTKHLASPPAIPQVRINEVLLAFVRAKVATKTLVKGVNLYRLDESRFS
ncbi:hypothetical protein JCM10212_005018 [Sporobolomyces blumeae]